MKKAYMKPEVLQHQSISFETAVSSCTPPSYPVYGTPHGNICLNEDYTWDPLNP